MNGKKRVEKLLANALHASDLLSGYAEKVLDEVEELSPEERELLLNAVVEKQVSCNKDRANTDSETVGALAILEHLALILL